MKTSFLKCKWVVTAVLLVSLCSCKQDNLAGTDGFATTLTLTQDLSLQRTVPWNAGSYTLTFTTNKYWTATLLPNDNSVTEASLSPVSGAPSEAISLSYYLPANRDYTPKVYHLTLTANQQTLQVEITQLPFDQQTQLSISPAEATFEPEGGEQAFTVTSNVDWSLSGIPTWCTITPTAGKAEQTVTVTATAALNTGAAREAQLLFTAGNLSKDVPLTQKRAIAQGTVSTADTVWFGAEKDSKAITLSATAAWTAKSAASWCVITPAAADATQGQDVVLTAAAYTGTTPRETEVLFYIGQDVKHRTVVVQCPPLEGSTWDVFVYNTFSAEYYSKIVNESMAILSYDDIAWADTLSLIFADGKAYIDGQEATYTVKGNQVTVRQTYDAYKQYDEVDNITRRFILDSLRMDFTLDAYHTKIKAGTTILSARFVYTNIAYEDDEQTEILLDSSCNAILVTNGGGNVFGRSPRQVEEQPDAAWYVPDSEKDPVYSGNLFTYLYHLLITDLLILLE